MSDSLATDAAPFKNYLTAGIYLRPSYFTLYVWIDRPCAEGR
jgi:hypothetical protein